MYNSNSIQMFSSSAVLSTWLSGVNSPYGISFDPLKLNMYIVSYGQNLIYQVPVISNVAGTPVIYYTSSSSGSITSTFTQPTGIVADNLAFVYVAFIGGNAVVKMQGGVVYNFGRVSTHLKVLLLMVLIISMYPILEVQLFPS